VHLVGSEPRAGGDQQCAQPAAGGADRAAVRPGVATQPLDPFRRDHPASLGVVWVHLPILSLEMKYLDLKTVPKSYLDVKTFCG
jgi:hypothetical protein